MSYDAGELRFAQNELAGIKKYIAEFEAASGLKVCGWDGRRIGEAVKGFRQIGRPEEAYGALVSFLENTLSAAKAAAGQVSERPANVEAENAEDDNG